MQQDCTILYMCPSGLWQAWIEILKQKSVHEKPEKNKLALESFINQAWGATWVVVQKDFSEN